MTDLFVETVGSTDSRLSLVPLHGPGLDHTYFRPWLDQLAADCQLVFFDQRLNGRSPRTSPIVPTLEVLADDVVNVTRRRCQGKVVLIGHSFSAWTALAAAARYRPEIHGIVLVAPGLSPTVGETLLNYLRQSAGQEVTQLVLDAFQGGVTTDARFGDIWRRVLPWYVKNNVAEVESRLFRETLFSIAGFNTFVAHAAGRLDATTVIRELSCPLLVVAGANDWLERDPHGGSGGVAGLKRDSTFAVIENSGHFPFAEQRTVFCATITGWIRDRL